MLSTFTPSSSQAYDPLDGAHAGAVAVVDGLALLAGPAPVAVHDDPDVARDPDGGIAHPWSQLDLHDFGLFGRSEVVDPPGVGVGALLQPLVGLLGLVLGQLAFILHPVDAMQLVVPVVE